MNCACGSSKKYSQCCEPLINGKSLPESAEQLMRSRYTAYTVADVDYLKNTLAPESRKDFDADATKKWAKEAKWKKLTIIATEKGTKNDDTGLVEFSAAYEFEGEDIQLHEVSRFRKSKEGQWYFVDGDAHSHPGGEDIAEAHARPATFVRASAKVGRNDPCTCGSGKKYKKCCGS